MDKYTIANLAGMFHLPFSFSRPSLILTIAMGGILMIFIQYWLTKKVMLRILKYYIRS